MPVVGATWTTSNARSRLPNSSSATWKPSQTALRLRWHLAQAQGAAGNTTQARATALTTLRPEPGPFPPGFRWNDYVLATVAFWDQDLPSFKHHAAQVATRTAADPVTRSMNVANAKILNKLLQCFGAPYREAVDCKTLPTKR